MIADARRRRDVGVIIDAKWLEAWLGQAMVIGYQKGIHDADIYKASRTERIEQALDRLPRWIWWPSLTVIPILTVVVTFYIARWFGV
jgi:hypothetical protein